MPFMQNEKTRRILDSVQQEKDRLSALLNSITDEVWFADTQKKFTLANPAALKEFSNTNGFIERDVEKLALSLEVVRPDGSPRPVEEAPPLRALKGEVVKNQEEIVRTPATGELRYRQVTAAPVRNASGAIIGSVSVVRDITERKKAEEALRYGNERLELTSAIANQLLSTTKPQTLIQELCEKVMAFLDCDVFFNFLADEQKEQLHLNAYAGVPVEMAKTFEWLSFGEAVCGCAAQEGKRIVCENIPDTLDHRTALVRSFGVKAYAAHPLFSEGKVIGTLSFGSKRKPTFTENELSLMKTVAAQVSVALERKKAEEKLRDSEALLGSFFNSPGIMRGIVELIDNVDIKHIRDNEVTASYLGLTSADLAGKLSSELGEPPERVQVWIKHYKQCQLSGHPTSFEYLDKQDSNELWLAATVTYLGIASSGYPRFSYVVTDITEYKKTEETLHKSEVWKATSLYTRKLIEASLDPLVTISVDGKITDVNKATEIVTGFRREQLIGSDFSDYFTEPEKARAGYKHVFTEGFVRDYPLAIRHKSGKITDVLYNATVYRNEASEIQGVFAAARDITELKKAEEEAQETAKKLKNTERLATIGATAGMVGHDIRNPLQAITGDVYLAKLEVDSMHKSERKKSLEESLSAVEKNVEYINKIVADLQDYARPLKPFTQEIDLENLIRDLLTKNGTPKNVKVSSYVENGAKNIVADPDMLKRILGNLVTNAVQAMAEGGSLNVRAFREADTCVITVKDTGVGIPEEAKARLFTPLFTTKSKGQGFGLAVVKRMTETLGGTITFESQEGIGTIFTVRLPLKK